MYPSPQNPAPADTSTGPQPSPPAPSSTPTPPQFLFTENETNNQHLYNANQHHPLRQRRLPPPLRHQPQNSPTVNPAHTGTKAAPPLLPPNPRQLPPDHPPAFFPAYTIPAPAHPRQNAFQRGSTRSSPSTAGSRHLLRQPHTPTKETSPANRREVGHHTMTGLRRPPLVQTVLPVHRPHLAPRTIPACRRPPHHPSPRPSNKRLETTSTRAKTSSPCPTTGSTLGSPPGISPSTWGRPRRRSTPISPKAAARTPRPPRVVHAPLRPDPRLRINFSDVNPPVHAWAALRVYQIERKATGKRRPPLPRTRLRRNSLINFTWWINRK